MAFLYGDWEVFAGMFFKGFDAKNEIIDPFRIPPYWPLVASTRSGFSSPLSFGLQTKNQEGQNL